MNYRSTRGKADPVGFCDAFANGLAPDGGLYVPESLPKLPTDLLEGDFIPYAALAFDVLRLFDTDHTGDDLIDLVDRSYGSFTNMWTAPLKRLSDELYVLELFHGPTLAFKDFGLQLVGNLFEDQIRRRGESINVVGATSGDTGAAAIHGLAGKEGVNVFILYPEGRISELQERQMTCSEEENVYPIPIQGSFDDAQRIVKELFGDLDFKREARLSAVNSINLARVLAQSIYYIHGYLQLPPERRAGAEFVVPTGNFGNVFAGWQAREMGVPLGRLVVATNQNDILFRLFSEGRYEPGDVRPSLAPSMDIQVASNFERFLYHQLGSDGGAVSEQMEKVATGAALELPGFDPGCFAASRASDEEILSRIAQAHERYDYVMDPHTACGFGEPEPGTTRVLLGTAHPAKFPDTIQQAIGVRPTHPRLEALRSVDPVKHPLPAEAGAVRDFILAHRA